MVIGLGVVFVNYRCAPAIAERAALRIAEGHHVVVVDNSGDYTGPGVVIDAGGNVGFGPACNLGAAAMPSEVSVLCLHNPDLDISTTDLDALVQRLVADPDSGAIVPALHTPNGVIESGYHEPQIARTVAQAAMTRSRSAKPPAFTDQQRPNTRRRPPSTPGHRFGSGALLVMRREAFESIGGFDERFLLYAEDLDLWYRLRNAGYSMIFANDLVASHDQASGAPTSSSWRQVLRFVGVELFLELHRPQSWRAFRRVHRTALPRVPGSPLHRLVADSWRRGESPIEVSAKVAEAFAEGIMDLDQAAPEDLERTELASLIVTRDPDLANIERLVEVLVDVGIEPVLADNASTNAHAIEALSKRLGATFWRSEQNHGLPHHLNRALDPDPPRWLLYLDQDSGVEAEQLKRLADAARTAATKVGIVSPQYRQISTGSLGYSGRTLARPTITPIGSGSLYRTAACRAVGGFDPRLPLDLCDHDMALALQSAGYQVLVEPDIVVEHQVGDRAPSVVARAAPGNHRPWRYYTKAAGLRVVVAKHWRDQPAWVARNVVGRVVETARSAWSSRDLRIVGEALRGALARSSKLVPPELLDATRGTGARP